LAKARHVATNAKRALRSAGTGASRKARAEVAGLELLIGRLDQVVAQTRVRLDGEMPEGATRLVSLHDLDAGPIKKGRIGKPVGFGYLAQVIDNEDGIVVDHSVHVGNPAEGPLLVPAIARVKKLVGRAPRTVTADRGYGEAKVDADPTGLGSRSSPLSARGARARPARQSNASSGSAN
jgi:IS5 family transposase